MAFLYRKGKTGPLEKKIITNSAVIRVGEAVNIESGFADSAGAGEAIYGVVAGIVGPNGEVLRNNGASSDFDPIGDYTAASDNQTVGKVSVLIQTSKDAIYSAPADATLGTTTGSNLAGYRMDHTAGGLTLDESTAVTTAAQWVSHGVDPEDSTKVLVSIYESQLDS